MLVQDDEMISHNFVFKITLCLAELCSAARLQTYDTTMDICLLSVSKCMFYYKDVYASSDIVSFDRSLNSRFLGGLSFTTKEL